MRPERIGALERSARQPSRSGRLAAVVVGLAAVAFAPPARADGDRTIGFSSNRGLLGMQDLIDARVPKVVNLRGAVRFEHESLNVESSAQRLSADEYSLTTVAGVSALGLLDAGLRLPFTVKIEKQRVQGIPTSVDQFEGMKDLELAGKVGFGLGPITLGPYGGLRFPSGARNLDHYTAGDLGACATFAILDDRIAVHGNLTSVWASGGRFSFGYRIGASVAPFTEGPAIFRLYGYLDGLEYEGTRGSDVRLGVGVQTLLFNVVTVELGTKFKLVDGDLPGSLGDIGTYTIVFGVGISFTF